MFAIFGEISLKKQVDNDKSGSLYRRGKGVCRLLWKLGMMAANLEWKVA